MPRRICIWMLAILGVLCAAQERARAQGYPFFVQPLSVEDLQIISDAVELSPQQRLEVLQAHSIYLDDLESLQSGPMKRFMDKGITMVTDVQPWGGNFAIPPRRELEQMIRDGRGVFTAFGKLDDDFFDTIAPLVSPEQLPRLELARTVRALERYRLVYLMVAGELNRGAGVHLIGWLIRNDQRLSPEMVDVLLDHQERLISLTQSLERASLSAVDSVLDKIDDMGLRDMDQQQMMMLAMDENLRNELIVWVDELTEPIQLSISRISEENQRAWRVLKPLLDEETARDMQRRLERRVWGRLCRQLHSHDSRFDRVIEVLDETDPRRQDAIDGQDRLRSATASLISEYAPIVEKQRRYRTIGQFSRESAMDGTDRIESIMERRDEVAEQAASLLLVLEADLPEEEEDGPTAVAGGEGGGGGDNADATQVFGGNISKLPMQPVTLEQLTQVLSWVNAPESSVNLAGMMHEEYLQQCNELGDVHFDAMQEVPQPEGRQGWRERSRAMRELNKKAINALAEHEESLFAGVELAMEGDAARSQLAQIRVALERARYRQSIVQDDWSMGSQPEARIDLTMLVLSTDAKSLDPAAREEVVARLVEIDESVGGTLEELETMLDRAQLLESRLNGPGAEDESFDPEVRQRIRESWQKRRAAVGELASDLVEINRDGIRGLASAMPESQGHGLMDAYRRAAFPDLFRDQDLIASAFEEAMSLETLGDEQRRRLQDLRMRHSSTWGSLTDELIALRSEGDVRPSSWPPSSESLNLALRNEQLRFRRGQVAQRHLAELTVLLEPEQRAMVPSLEKAL